MLPWLLVNLIRLLAFVRSKWVGYLPGQRGNDVANFSEWSTAVSANTLWSGSKEFAETYSTQKCNQFVGKNLFVPYLFIFHSEIISFRGMFSSVILLIYPFTLPTVPKSIEVYVNGKVSIIHLPHERSRLLALR